MNFEALIITLSVVGGAVLLAVAVCCACCCCRRKRSRKPDKSEERAAREREERRIRQEERCGLGWLACEAAAGVACGPELSPALGGPWATRWGRGTARGLLSSWAATGGTEAQHMPVCLCLGRASCSQHAGTPFSPRGALWGGACGRLPRAGPLWQVWRVPGPCLTGAGVRLGDVLPRQALPVGAVPAGPPALEEDERMSTRTVYAPSLVQGVVLDFHLSAWLLYMKNILRNLSIGHLNRLC